MKRDDDIFSLFGWGDWEGTFARLVGNENGSRGESLGRKTM